MPNREVIASPIAYTDTFTHAGFSGLLSKVNDICDIQIPLLSLPVQVYGTSIKLPAWFSIFSMWKLISLNMIFDPLFSLILIFIFVYDDASNSTFEGSVEFSIIPASVEPSVSTVKKSASISLLLLFIFSLSVLLMRCRCRLLGCKMYWI